MTKVQKGAFRDEKTILEKLNEFFALVFTAKDTEKIPMLDRSFLVDRSEDLDHTEVTTDESFRTN